jgi:hypothetical protein
MSSVDPCDRRNDTFLKLSKGFSAGDGAPILCALYLEECRISVGHLFAEYSALPLPQVDLSKVGFNDGGLTDGTKERGCGLCGALKGCDIDSGELHMTKPLTNLCGLPVSVRCQGRISLAIDECEWFTLLKRGRLAMTNEKDFRRPRGCLKWVLSVLDLFVSHGGKVAARALKCARSLCLHAQR